VNPAPASPSRWPALAAIWACVAVVLCVQAWATLPAGANAGFTAWVMIQQVGRALFWALLTPVVVRLRERLPLHGPRRYAHLVAHLAFAVAGMVSFWALRVPVMLWINDLPFTQLTLEVFVSSFNPRNLVDVALYWCAFVGAWVFGLLEARQRHEVNEAELRMRLAESELGALRQQVQPHFLFNALNAIGALVRLDRKREAVHALAQLSALQRTLLESAGVPAVPLAQEIAFVERYLAIEQLRFGERMAVTISVDAAAAEVPVPNLLLQPIVENAVKHGVARRSGPTRVSVNAVRLRGALRLVVRNDPPEADVAAGPGTGFGLRGARERLERLYAGRAALHFDPSHPDGVTVTLDLPLSPTPSALV
jgi:two-component system LytT family sensor kinase